MLVCALVDEDDDDDDDGVEEDDPVVVVADVAADVAVVGVTPCCDGIDAGSPPPVEITPPR